MSTREYDFIVGPETATLPTAGTPSLPDDFVTLGYVMANFGKYTTTFNATTDWGSASGGYYTITKTAATHGLGISPSVDIYELVGSDYIKVGVDRVLINSSGDVSIRVPDSPDLRFAGKIIIR